MRRVVFRWAAGVAAAVLVWALAYSTGTGFDLTEEPALFASAAVVILGMVIVLVRMRVPDEPRWDDLSMARRSSDRSLDTPGIAPYIAPDEESRRRLAATLRDAVDDRVRSEYGFDPGANPARAREVLPRRVHEFFFDEDPLQRLAKIAYVDRLVSDIENLRGGTTASARAGGAGARPLLPRHTPFDTAANQEQSTE